jgi:deoxyribodipyrimidine photo-lyase
MAAVAPERWFVSSHDLATVLAGAASVRSVSDPHMAHRLQAVARLDAEPALFPPVEQPCSSFSQWWTRCTRGLQHAQDLL